MKSAITFSNNILSEALIQYQTERIDNEYPSIEDYNKQYIPNKQTEEKINRLIRIEKKPYFVLINTIGKRVACVVIAMLIAMTTTVFSVKALRDPFVNFIVKTYEKFSTVIFENTETKSGKNTIITQRYEPTYIPDGYKKTFEETLSLSYFCEYTNDSGDKLTFEQNLIENAQAGIDTENSVLETIYINGIEGLYFENKSLHNIMFSNKQYSFFVSGRLLKSELIQIAESIENNK